jgi:hypothetical protein
MTNRELIKTMNLIVHFIGDNKTKTQMKLSKIFESLDKYRDAMNVKVNGLKLDFASVDADGNLVFEKPGGEYKYKKDARKELDLALLKLADEPVEDFKPITIVNPKGLEEYTFLKPVVVGIDFVDPVDQDDE